jgi:hypothetical protein
MNNPPPLFPAVLLLVDAPWLNMIETDDITHTPPLSSPVSLPSMELLDAVKLLVCK